MLFDNNREAAVLGSSNRPLKSLTDMIKGSKAFLLKPKRAEM